jgi:ring-1,2-phenylacetyl-CoA epoxidase subunit PaaD
VVTPAQGVAAVTAVGDSSHQQRSQDQREAAAWSVLHTVLDPEVPALSVCDLGIVRAVSATEQGVDVVLTPTYSGCPATEVIAHDISTALLGAGLGPVRITHRLAPAWTSDWITPQGKDKLRAYGIAPPSGLASVAAPDSDRPTIRIRPKNVVCPRCGSGHTERLSAFGSTACKALHRCLDCREPFEHFKPL